MELPEEIPVELRELAQELPEFEDFQGGWVRMDAIAVIESLEGTEISISDVGIFDKAPEGYVPADRFLVLDRYHNEADSDYAERSRLLALEFIADSETVNDETLFALTFLYWKDAA